MAAKELHGELNPAFTNDSGQQTNNNLELNGSTTYNEKPPPTYDAAVEEGTTGPARDTWGGGLEFLMSCIAMSVGLGNIWRFPFTAYENGGGAFLIPYIIVLIFVGKPLYFMEMILGQFSSKGSVKVYDISPAMRGIGVGQTIAVTCVMTYYSSLMALIFYYFIASFSSTLPWSVCDPSWPDECYPSTGDPGEISSNATSSAQLYFKRTVLREPKNIDDGIGNPGWKLSLCLLFSWLCIFLVLLKGVKSSGKAAYFLAIFPYVIMLVLFIKALTLEGSGDGILFFISPDWNKILDAQVWYSAVTQSFFSLNVCFGNVVMYASYNKFKHPIYRDTLVVTTLDTFTSLLAGFTVFGILGNLAFETGKDVGDVVQGGTGLAFVSYPEAISKFDTVPQLFAVLFFFMLFVLGVGSNVAMASSVITVVRDRFPNIPHWVAVCGCSVFGFGVALVYVTPGGQFILNLVDHHGGTFIVYILGIGQLITVTWIYGMKRFSDDIQFMLDRKISLYWRICWPIVTPAILIAILLYSLISMDQLTYENIKYPVSAIVCGWLLSAFGVVQLPAFAFLSFWKRRALGWPEMVKDAFKPRAAWGPTEVQTKREWIVFTEEQKKMRETRDVMKSGFRKFWDNVFGY